MTPRTTRRTIAIVASFAFGAGLAGTACVIADPPAEIPVPPLTRPEILHAEAVPSVTSILRTWPLEFVIPIYAPDPTRSVQWQAFFDYDPTPPHLTSPPFEQPQELDADPAGDDGGVRVLSTRLDAPADLTTCHTLEILVALTFQSPHTPDSTGGDSITWFYSPSGSLEDCPVYDAGPFDAGPDAANGKDGADTGDGAGE